jgi:PLP dependent protein
VNAAERYLKILECVGQLAVASGRDASEITVLAVSKKQPIEKMMKVYDAGCRDFGESRVQESLDKLPQLPEDARVHLIGTLQKNKVRQSIGHYSLVHSVDSFSLAEKLSAESLCANLATPVLIQVNTSGEETKHGLSEQGWRPLLESLFTLKGIALKGLMTMAPLTSDEKVIRHCFSSLRKIRDEWRRIADDPILLQHLSMGMSSDFPIAIQEGATLLRIGRAIFE